MTSRRLAPPVLGPDLLVRYRLVEALGRRWEHRVIMVQAGIGYGKSTALAQAIAVNRLAPRGVDRWLRCEPGDRVASHFVAGLAAATGFGDERLRHDPDAVLDALLDQIAVTWPLGVALFLDDVHEVTGAGAEQLRRLLHDAPACLHLVLASRAPVPGLARMRALGQVLDLGESDLRLDVDELSELAERHAIPVTDLTEIEGWPALANLAARNGGSADDAFTLALEELSPPRRRSLAEVVATGGGSPDTVTAAQSSPWDLDRLLEGLPLVARHPDGSVVPHQLWETILDGVIDDEAAAAARSRVAAQLLLVGNIERAAPLAAQAQDWPLFRRVLERACGRGYAGPPRDVLARWLELLPDHLHDEPEGLLLRGVTGRADEPFSERTRDLLERAMSGFRETDRVAGEVAAMSEYVYVTRIRGEIDRLPPVLMRLVELDAAGHREVEGPFRLARALLAEASGSDDSFLAELDAIPPAALSPEWMAVVEYLRSQVLLNLGRSAESVAAADRSADYGGPSYLGAFYAAALMRWYAGDPERALALPLAAANTGATPVDRLYAGMYTAMVDAFAGRPRRARANLEHAEQAHDAAIQSEVLGELAGARAAVAVACGDEDLAAAVLRDRLTDAPLDTPAGRRPMLRFLALTYVLVPEARPSIETTELGPAHQQTLAVARALVAARAGTIDEIDPATLVPATAVAVRLPLRWTIELAAALVAADRPVGRDLGAGLAVLHGKRFSEATRARREAGDPGARQLLRVVAVDGGASASIGILGATTLSVDGVAVSGGEWGRRAVRATLSVLAARGRVPRDEVLDAVWPELDQVSAERNLRVVLTHLNRLLEPHREAGEASFLLRTGRGELWLAPLPHVDIDATRFDLLIEQAERSRLGAAPSHALPAYEEALDLWRGVPLAELGDHPWALTEGARLRARFVLASVRAAEIHLAAGDGDRAVARAADALQVEPWSEDAYRLLVAAHLHRGDRPSAQRALQRCLDTVAELGATPAPETLMVQRLVAEGAVTAAS